MILVSLSHCHQIELEVTIPQPTSNLQAIGPNHNLLWSVNVCICGILLKDRPWALLWVQWASKQWAVQEHNGLQGCASRVCTSSVVRFLVHNKNFVRINQPKLTLFGWCCQFQAVTCVNSSYMSSSLLENQIYHATLFLAWEARVIFIHYSHS